MTRTIVLASGNPAKLERLRRMVEGLEVSVLLPAQVKTPPALDEDGGSHSDVAAAKALAWSKASGALALASDGGVEIPALGAGWESLFTRRAAGPSASDADRASHLLGLMHGYRGQERAARWREAAALADCGQLIGVWEAENGEEMRIADSYDPAGVPAGFYVPGLLEFPRLGRRFGELSEAERELALDHWERLERQVRQVLQQVL